MGSTTFIFIHEVATKDTNMHLVWIMNITWKWKYTFSNDRNGFDY